MTYNYSVVKWRRMIDEYVPTFRGFIGNVLNGQEGHLFDHNLITGRVHGSGTIKDCVIEGDLYLEDDSVVIIGCTVARECSLHVGKGTVVLYTHVNINARSEGDSATVRIGRNCTVVNSEIAIQPMLHNGEIAIGDDCTLIMTDMLADNGANFRVKIGSGLKSCASKFIFSHGHMDYQFDNMQERIVVGESLLVTHAHLRLYLEDGKDTNHIYLGDEMAVIGEGLNRMSLERESLVAPKAMLQIRTEKCRIGKRAVFYLDYNNSRIDVRHITIGNDFTVMCSDPTGMYFYRKEMSVGDAVTVCKDTRVEREAAYSVSSASNMIMQRMRNTTLRIGSNAYILDRSNDTYYWSGRMGTSIYVAPNAKYIY